MSSTLDIYRAETVLPNYSWDQGIPTQDFIDLIKNPKLLAKTNENTGTIEKYIGHAPLFSVILSSAFTPTLPNLLSVERTVTFGDYYNSESNIVTNTTLSNVAFCHTYIMPGEYTITYKVKEYFKTTIATEFVPFPCVETFGGGADCLEWTWKNLDCTTNPSLSVTWSLTLPGEEYRKFWKYEQCLLPGFTGGVYTQPVDQPAREPLSWQWFNFLCESPTNPYNTPTNWKQTEFQAENQLFWSETTPCVILQQLQDVNVNWRWENLECNSTIIEPYSPTTKTWDELVCAQTTGRSWTNLALRCSERSTQVQIISSITTTETEKKAFVKVLENPPKAILSFTNQPSSFENRISPLTIRLTPRFTKCGSFPIERIVWDLGDGSPLLEQKRWNINVNVPFVYNRTYISDPFDPRNYDVIHTYKKTSRSEYAFYPSLTAFASSTGTSDSVSNIVGPLKLPDIIGEEINLIQAEMVSDKNLYLAEINKKIVLFNTSFKQSEMTEKLLELPTETIFVTETETITETEKDKCLKDAPYLIFKYDSGEASPETGFKRHKACYRCVVLQVENGQVLNQEILQGETTTNLDLVQIIKDNNLILQDGVGSYLYVFEFYGWRNKLENQWISSDTSYTIRSSCLTNWNDLGIWYDNETWFECL